jgi:phosphoribosylformylglycinamidine cyclo-ligase
VTAPSYETAGVSDQSGALSAVARFLGPTLAMPTEVEHLTRFGHYAAVMKLTDDLAVAVSTDGVGSKTVVAAALDRYDTIGFDCVAMNANDVVCVGARPVALVDYLAVNKLDSRRTEEILQGLGAAAKEAGVAVPAGELAQLPDVIGSDGSGHADERAFDLVGTCIGTLSPDEIVLGQEVTPGDALIGIASSGIHSNGLTLARRVLGARGMRLTDTVNSLGCSVGEELLRPTEIYVRAVTELWAAGVETKGLVHVTGDGLLNLCRLDAPVGYDIDQLPPTPEIFELIHRSSDIAESEMFAVFNMGVGFVVVVDESAAGETIRVVEAAGHRALRIGSVTDQTGRVRIAARGLEGELGQGFRPAR